MDFGLSCIFDAVGKSKRRKQDDEDSFYEATAPEVIAGEPFSQKSDVWSFGLVMLELVLKKPPQHLRPELLKTLIPEHCNKIHKSIISACLSIKPDERPSFSKIVENLSLPEACCDVPLDNPPRDVPVVSDLDMMSPAAYSDPESQNMSPCYQPYTLVSSGSGGGSRYGKLSDYNYLNSGLASASGSAVGVGEATSLFNPKQGLPYVQQQQNSQGHLQIPQMQQQLQQHEQHEQNRAEKMSVDSESQKDSNAMSTSTYSVVDMEIQSTEDVKIITYPIN